MRKIALHYKAMIFLTISTLAALLLVWFSFRLISSERFKIRTNLEMESTRLERVFIDKIEHTFSIIKSMNHQILKNPTNKVYINEILQKFRTSPDLSNTFSWTIFSWADSKHQITVDAEYGVMKVPFDLSIRDYIPLTMKYPNEFHLGSSTIGSTSKKWMIPGGVGLVNKDGKYLGAMTIGFEIETLARALHAATKSDNVEFELINENEIPILHGNSKSFGISKTQTVDEDIATMINELKNSNSNTISDISFRKKRAYLLRKIDKYPYLLFLKYNSKSLSNNLWLGILSRSIEIIAMLAACIFLIALIFKREEKQKQKILTLKQVAEQANAAKSEFLSQTAHEFKNFIYGIIGSAEIVKNDLTSKVEKLKKSLREEDLKEIETDLEFTNEIIDSAHELSEFVNDMIDLNQAETGEFKINKNKSETDVGRIIKQSIKLLNKRSTTSNIKIISGIADDLHKLSNLDHRRIKQIIVNLVSNSIKYSPKGTEITITAKNISDKMEIDEINTKTASYNPRRIKILIKDQGFGMTKEEMEYALQKYHIIENENSGKVDSLGLGLPIVKFLIEKQDGILEIKSEKNKGTEVVVIL